MPKDGVKERDEFRVAITSTVIWVAGLTLIVLFAALLLGIWLDRVLGSKPILTIVFILASIPATLFMTFKVVKKATNRLQANKKEDTT
jgi:F0F1-type ATP synthase assembly protein I